MTTYSVATGGATTTDATTVPGPVSGGAETPVSATDGSTAGPGVKAPAVDPGVKAPSVDTVTLQGKVRYAVKLSPKPGNGTTGGRIGSVLFVYSSKGALQIKFMDSKNTLVYQTPPTMMASTVGLMMRPNTSVSARV